MGRFEPCKRKKRGGGREEEEEIGTGKLQTMNFFRKR